MEKINKDSRVAIKRFLASIMKRIDKAENVNMELRQGTDEAININTGRVEYAPNGELTVYIKLYEARFDKRAKLFTRCGTRP